MFYVGLDVHLKSYVVCVLDSKGNVVKRATTKNLEQLLDLLGKLTDRFSVCFEASCGYGHIHDQLAKRAAKVVVAHPGFLALIYRSKKKNDRRDAEKLAQLLSAGMVPEVHVPSGDVRVWRETISFRRKVIQKRTRAKNGMRALLRSLGISVPRSPGLWTKHGMTWLKEIEFDQSLSALKRDMLVDEIESLSKQVRTIEKELKRYAESRVEVWQLQSIPGVGPRTAEAVVATAHYLVRVMWAMLKRGEMWRETVKESGIPPTSPTKANPGRKNFYQTCFCRVREWDFGGIPTCAMAMPCQ